MTPAPFCTPAQRPLLLAAAILASALGFIDSTVVAIALPAMRETLGAGLAQAQWIHNAYMLTLSALILVGGAVGDRFGLARIFGLGIALFVAASLVCALAPGPEVLIGARAVQGIGAAVMVPGSLALIARAYPAEIRGRAIGIWAAASALTTALGPIIGGLALSFGGPEMWRWIFAVNLPLGALALVLVWRGTGRDTHARSATRIDAPGALVASLALLALAYGLTAAGHDGRAAPDLRWIAAGVAGLALFVIIEARSPAPMVPLALFRSPVFSAANGLSFLLYAALSIMFFYMPMTFIAGWGVSEIEASASFAPMSVFISLLSSRAGRVADRVGPAPLLTVGSLIVAAGYLSMGLLAPAQEFWRHMLPAMCLVGLGMALVVAPLSTAVMGAAPQTQSGTASGINNAVSRLAGLIAVAAVGGLAAASYSAAGGVASFGVASDTGGHAEAMTAGFQTLAYVSAALCLASAALAPLTRLPQGAPHPS